MFELELVLVLVKLCNRFDKLQETLPASLLSAMEIKASLQLALNVYFVPFVVVVFYANCLLN